ncbi:hypothetical protein [Cyanobacterium aponinum]|nr:hypothetical protein [Cyanobacterium aponinum]
MPTIPQSKLSPKTRQRQPAPSPTFQFPPIPPIPRWLNPFGNPNPRF